jgi:diacylglycerol kinase (ATP)
MQGNSSCYVALHFFSILLIMLRLYRAFCYSIAGLQSAFKEEAAFRLEIYLSLIMLPQLFYLPIPASLKWATAAAHLLVMITELINSAIEAVVDMVTQEQHPLAKKAKDMASAAVLLTLIPTTVIWFFVVFLSIRNALY